MFDLFRPSMELSGVGFGIMQLFTILYINCYKEAANRVPIQFNPRSPLPPKKRLDTSLRERPTLR